MARNSMAQRTGRPGAARCAIYTRKSSEDGLEQTFNSLDAQREACLAYITSQRHEGWKALPALYDDDGFSGGSFNRPALQRVLADIQVGRIDRVVIYKVDRLTRSLADFAKLVETFDAHGVSFVSITQQFNTTTSMGRLTLNMLLSFVQFEREVTGERIRDKIAASKRRGMWMGGPLPLGYDLRDRKLVINQAEAETVRHIFRSYLELGCVRLLEQRLGDEGVRSKVHRKADGSSRGENRSFVARCISSSRTGCIGSRSATRAPSTRASIPPSSTRRCGMPCKSSWWSIAPTARIVRTERCRAC
jgi:site-specific DNA recombinase